jgi:hypothetical protein
MVRTEERDKYIGMAREGRGMPIAHSTAGPITMVSSSYDDVYNNKEEAPVRTRDKIEKTEKEIVRLTMIAEKDKRESIACTNKIKKLREQLQDLLDNSQGEEIRRCYSENDLAAQFNDKYACSMTPPASSLPSFRVPLPNSSLRADAENKSPNISPKLSPLPDELSKSQESTKLEKVLASKEDELTRVKQRAKEEAARASLLRREEEELVKTVANEMESRMRANQDMKAAIAKKEREIQRLTMLAERDKRTGMFMRDQIEHQKKTLTAFSNAHADKRPELLRVINSCDEIVVPSSPTASCSAGSYSSTGSITPLSLTPTSPSNISLLRSSSLVGLCSSPLKAEADTLLRVDATKEEELFRVSAIAEMEACKASILKTKAEEMKRVIATELQVANEELERKIKKIRIQQDAIHKVVARAEVERAKACALHEELESMFTVSPLVKS